MGEEEVGRAVQADSRLPGPRAALDHERRLGRARDEAVLVRLDRRDDVPHAGVPGAFELLEQEVVERGGRILERAVERLVADPGQRPAAQTEAPAEPHPVR